jgi:hypothetical protein
MGRVALIRKFRKVLAGDALGGCVHCNTVPYVFLRFGNLKKGVVQMSVSKIATAAVMALSLVAAPTVAAAAPAASKLSVASARTSAPVAKGNKAVGGGLIIALLAGAAVIAGIIIAADSGKSAVSR